MKIAIVTNMLNIKTGGGSNHSLHLVASKLAKLGNEVMVISLNPSLDAYPEDLPYSVIRDVAIPNQIDRGNRIEFQRVLRKYENKVDIYDIRHPEFALGAAIYRFLGGKVPVVAHLNNYNFCPDVSHMNDNCPKSCSFSQSVWHHHYNPARKVLLLPFFFLEHNLENLLLKHVDAFTAISPAVAEIYTRHKIDNNKIFIAPAGIDHKYLSNLKNNFSCQPQIAGNPYTILYVGRLSQEKGVDLLINAIRKLEFQVKVHIVGDGPKIDDLKKLSYELGLSECIVFHGWLPYDKVIDVYSGSQLFIHPARWPEPLGRTILDAMAIGVPVIAADSGGPPWALSGTGLTFVPGDTDDLVKKINTVYRNTSLAVNLAVRAQERAKYFDYNKTIPELLDVYNGVIEKAMTKKT